MAINRGDMERGFAPDRGIVLPLLCRECEHKFLDSIFAKTKPGAVCCTSCNGNNVGIDPSSWLGMELAVLLRNALGICD